MDDIQVCAYCGTEYPASRRHCPLCGMDAEEAKKALEQADLSTAAAAEVMADMPHAEPHPVKNKRKKGGARVAKRSDRVPTWMTVLICIILAIALFVGVVLAVISFSSTKEPTNPVQTDQNLSLPGEDQQNPDTDNSSDQTDHDLQNPSDTTPDDSNTVVTTPTVACTALSINHSDVSLKEAGESFVIQVTMQPENCTEEVVWTVEDPEICSVDNGTVVALDGGTTTITVTCGNQTASCIVRCNFPHTGAAANGSSGNYTLSSEDMTLFSAGETAQLTLNSAAGETVTWSSSNEGVATVNASGKVTAVDGGTATIKATVNGKTLSCIVRCNFKTVNAAPSNTAETGNGYHLSHEDVTLSIGESFTLNAVDAVGQTASGAVYSSSNDAVCTIRGATITAVGSGTATVTVTVGGSTMKCIVRAN